MSAFAYKPFGACLSELLARHKLTAASVSRTMGHKSRTTLQRILQDQASPESMEKFFEEFKAVHLIELTAEEDAELKQALEISRIGTTGFLARNMLCSILHAAPSDPDEIEIHDAQTGRCIRPGQFFSELVCAEKLRMLIINGIPAAFSEALSRFLLNAEGDVEIEHYLFLDGNIARTAQSVFSILPALNFSCYAPYAIVRSEPDTLQRGGLTASVLVVRAHMPNGRIREYQLGFSSQNTGHLIHACSGLYRFWQGMVEPGMPLRSPIKQIASAPADSLDSYLHMADCYRELEKNHALYMLKPGLCLSLISPELLASPMRDGIYQTAFRDDPAADEFLRRLMEIHAQRFENIYQKKRVTHMLTSYDSLRTFAQTGLLTDHFFGLRPFTVHERREILIHCRNQTRDNPYFNLYLLKSDAQPIMRQVSCFESAGVLIRDAKTDYNLSAAHADALITLPDFTALFSRYFRETLLPLRAHSVGTSVSILNSLIDELPEE